MAPTKPTGAMRCSLCNVNLPLNKKICPGCNKPTWFLGKKEEEDHDWEEVVGRIKKRVTLEWNDFIPNVAAGPTELIKKDGELFIHDEKLQEYGYLDLQSGSIVKINEEFYEVYGAVYPGTEASGWWIKVIPVEGFFDNATPELLFREMMVDGKPC